MSNLHNRISDLASTRLSILGRNASNLTVQLAELHELRDHVRKAQLSARKSRPKSRKKTPRI
jgi:hypothetical protein